MEINQPNQTHNPLTQLALLLLLAGAGIVFGSIAVIAITSYTLHVPLTGIADALLKPENIQLSRIVQAGATFLYMALPAIIFGRIISRKPFAALGFNDKINLRQIALVAAIVFVSLLLSSVLGDINKMIPIPADWAKKFQQMEDAYNDQVLLLTAMKTPADYMVSLLLIALLPAIFEEMFFRGAVQQVLIKLFSNPFIGILITSIFFSAIHLSFYGFAPRMFLGMMLGYLFYFSKNLWLNITAHFLNNTVALTQMYLLSRQGKLTADAMDDSVPYYYGIAAAIGLYVFFVRFKKESEKQLAD